ncbi:MAG TPA: transcription-repair coupling factor [Terriglobia bacterium]|nr:transcription-repair coupling factor [Terriglobia bacterium]
MPNLRSLLNPILEHAAFRGALRALTAVAPGTATPVTVSGLTSSPKALLVAALAHRLARPVVVLTADTETAANFQRTTSTFHAWLEPHSSLAVLTLPSLDCSPYEGRSPHAEILERRAVTLWSVAQGRARVLYVPVAAALGRFRERAFYSSLALEIKVGDELALDDLAEHLAGVGYEREEPVSDVGQFSVRGGIVDVFPPEAAWPFRIELSGDRIESLREYNPDTQRSRRPVARALLLPLSETRRSPQFFEKLVRALDQRALTGGAAEAQPNLRVEREPEWAGEYGNPFPGWEFFAPLAEPQPRNLLELFDNPVLLWDEPLDRDADRKRFLEGLASGFDEVRDVIPPRPRPEDVFLTEEEFLESIRAIPQLYFKELSLSREVESRESRSQEPASEGGFGDLGHAAITTQESTEEAIVSEAEQSAPATEFSAEEARRPFAALRAGSEGRRYEEEFVFLTQPSPKFEAGVKGLVDNLRGALERGMSVVLVSPSSGKADRLRGILTEYEIPFGTPTEESISAGPSSTGTPACAMGDTKQHRQECLCYAIMVRGDLAEGFVIPDLGQMWLADSDLFGGFDWASRRREHSGVLSFISGLGDLKVGDYVVHVDHGVGIYQGLRQLSVNGSTRDFMLLTYLDDAKLYVPLERLDLVEKYRASGEGAKPVLDRLGGSGWERTKSRVKRALRDMAQELLHLYAERKMAGGAPTSPDTPWQEEFEEAFEFEETPDQLKALADIKQDLESQEPMDRLLCGDVGYGKTELAMRAAFKVIQDGRQVAVLAPTTVLAFQHYTTFRQRLAAFPMRVEMLSRFRQPAEQKKIVAETEAGKVDVLIGTHRLLSKDVRFRELGLLIVDEEQRFGVAAKERLRKLRAGVDVLAMSATPIPRTLHMSLGGLRDLSVIETPPRGRLAIQTTVAPFSQNIIQSAILKEMQREGQAFFVHNRVESIFSIAAIVQRLVPTARIGVAHGQMDEKELERVMLKFMQGEYEVLVATALIENGLDIPRANTIIVNHAERFGLADLYQLRGRVGRSNRRAYAYFLVAAEEALTPTARRRLAALKEFSELGAGFRLAALDLELRGAGNLLGAEQHGHLNAIGIDLYLKMLEQTVEELKGAPPRIEVRTTLNLGLDIKIPDSYVADESQRLRLYKRISSLATPEARAELEAELIDRYGPIPPSVSNLFSYGLLKSAAEQLLVQSIERKAEDIWMRFHEQTPLEPKRITTFVRRRREASLRPDGVLRFRLRGVGENTLQEVQNVLQELRA